MTKGQIARVKSDRAKRRNALSIAPSGLSPQRGGAGRSSRPWSSKRRHSSSPIAQIPPRQAGSAQ
eukprot:8807494-Pyramimonas_sp.AAC.1